MEIGSKENRKSIYFFPVDKIQENEFFSAAKLKFIIFSLNSNQRENLIWRAVVVIQ